MKNKKYHTIGTFLKSIRKITERGNINTPKTKMLERGNINTPNTQMLERGNINTSNTQMHDLSLSWIEINEQDEQ
jgi:hypothetical protein